VKSEELFEAARRVIPGGVNSPVRAYGSVGGTPRFIARAAGAAITDVEGTEYIDYVGSWGVMLLGHDHPAVRRATAEALKRGTSFGAPTEAEVRLAERLVEMVPSVEQVRLVNSGTEATMSALRLARGITGRPAVIKFRGGYHGHGDSFLVEAGSGAATLGVPSSPGVTSGAAADTLVAEYNDLTSVAAAFELRPDGVACVVVEPVAGNMGCVPPEPGFLEGLRRLCDTHGALLVFDEVMTGFRVAAGGAQARFGVLPDLTTLGKVMGGGLPVGAYGGPSDLMSRVAPEGPVYQAGTLSGNPLATAAGLATLEVIRSDARLYERLEMRTRQLGTGLVAAADEADVSACWNGVGAMGSLFFTEGPVSDWTSAAAADRDRYGRFFHGMLDRGIYLAPSPFEAWFVSAAHTDAHIERTLTAAREVMETL
jgi:glutamate-1-semialdehyde 2,1-aminomutase